MTPAPLPALLPRPRSVEPGDGWLRVPAGFRFAWSGHRDAVLDRAVERFHRDVARLTGGEAARPDGAELRIDCRGADRAWLTLDASERYSLTVATNGAVLTADGPAGVLRGLATLRQAITALPIGFAVPALRIDDAPRFAWRGVMIDVARRCYSVAALQRQLDTMERVKLNVLHLHLSDDEGFRVESRLHPQLHEGSAPGCYSQAEIRELVAYAADRGVRVVPELDVPGHSRALLRAFPQYAAGAGSTLDPSNPETFRCLDRLFGEMAALFPDRCFHVGGDEVDGADWQASPRVQAFARSRGLHTVAELEAWFFARVREIVVAHGKTVVGWEEVARGGIPTDVLVQTWRSSAAIARVTGQGHRVIATCGYYLDELWPAADHYRVDPHDPAACGVSREQLAAGQAMGLPHALLGEDQCVDRSLQLTPPQQALVLGGEAALWSEAVTEQMLDGRLWPRAAAVAERLWSPPSVRDPHDMLRRLVVVHEGSRVLGLADETNRADMVARLAPDAAEPVNVLLDVVAPVRNHAHDRATIARWRGEQVSQPQQLDELADAASADTLVALRFQLDVERFVRGDRAGAGALAATLAAWRGNHERFAAVAKGRPKLEAALPVSADVAALAALGLDAIAAIASGSVPAADWCARARELLVRQDAAERASAGIVEVLTVAQPPADLLIRIASGIRELVAAAVGGGR